MRRCSVRTIVSQQGIENELFENEFPLFRFLIIIIIIIYYCCLKRASEIDLRNNKKINFNISEREYASTQYT